MLNTIASNFEHTAQSVSEKPDAHLSNSAYDLSKDNSQSTGVMGAVDKFAHEHPYALAAAGVVVGAGVLALTRGKLAAVGEFFSPLAQSSRSEFGFLNQARSALTSQRSSLGAFGRPVTNAVARESGSLSMMTAEVPVGISSKTLNLGEAVGRVPKGMLSARDSLAGASHSTIATSGDATSSTFVGFGPRPLKVYLHTGEKAAVDVSKAGPLQYLKTNRPETLKSPFSSDQAQAWESFGSKINHAAGDQVGRYPFRVSPDIDSPVAVLSHEGFIRSLIVPTGTTKAQLSEAMTIASSANRMFANIAAEEATYTTTKLVPGFIQKVVEVETRSPHEMTGYALKGASDWIRGAPGNNYTRYLRDWHGNFTRADRTFLHKMFSSERVPVRLFPNAQAW